jgi:hypothetical protein
MIIEGKASRPRPRRLEVACSLALGVDDEAPRLAPTSLRHGRLAVEAAVTEALRTPPARELLRRP